MHSADAIHEKRHPIQVAARRAGLSPHVLRAWEKRYGDVVAPGRSAGGRRLYSDADIERLRLLHEATRAGRRIGDVLVQEGYVGQAQFEKLIKIQAQYKQKMAARGQEEARTPTPFPVPRPIPKDTKATSLSLERLLRLGVER